MSVFDYFKAKNNKQDKRVISSFRFDDVLSVMANGNKQTVAVISRILFYHNKHSSYIIDDARLSVETDVSMRTLSRSKAYIKRHLGEYITITKSKGRTKYQVHQENLVTFIDLFFDIITNQQVDLAEFTYQTKLILAQQANKIKQLSQHNLDNLFANLAGLITSPTRQIKNLPNKTTRQIDESDSPKWQEQIAKMASPILNKKNKYKYFKQECVVNQFSNSQIGELGEQAPHTPEKKDLYNLVGDGQLENLELIIKSQSQQVSQLSKVNQELSDRLAQLEALYTNQLQTLQEKINQLESVSGKSVVHIKQSTPTKTVEQLKSEAQSKDISGIKSLSIEILHDWIDYLAANRKKFKLFRLDDFLEQCREVDKCGHNVNHAIKDSIRNGWQSAFYDRHYQAEDVAPKKRWMSLSEQIYQHKLENGGITIVTGANAKEVFGGI